MRIGYIRTSTVEQHEDRQVEMMKSNNVEKVFIEKVSGNSIQGRVALSEMLEFVRSGDVVITESISRIARNTRDLLSIISTLSEKGVEFISLKENIDTSTAQGKFMLTVFGAIAELERESILQRQREGIEIAKRQGKYRGRKPIDLNDIQFKRVCEKWRQGTITAVQAMAELNLKPNTFYRRVKEMQI